MYHCHEMSRLKITSISLPKHGSDVGRSNLHACRALSPRNVRHDGQGITSHHTTRAGTNQTNPDQTDPNRSNPNSNQPSKQKPAARTSERRGARQDKNKTTHETRRDDPSAAAGPSTVAAAGSQTSPELKERGKEDDCGQSGRTRFTNSNVHALRDSCSPKTFLKTTSGSGTSRITPE